MCWIFIELRYNYIQRSGTSLLYEREVFLGSFSGKYLKQRAELLRNTDIKQNLKRRGGDGLEVLFWSCFLGGAMFAFLTAILGDLFGGWLEGIFDIFSLDFLTPVVSASAITTFGGAGILLARYTRLSSLAVLILSILIAVVLSAIIYLAYVKPMENSENSIGFSHAELPGKLGEVTVPIPSKGFGEIMVKFVAGNTLHTAASWDRRDIPAGALVVIVDSKDGVVQVSELYETESNKEMM